MSHVAKMDFAITDLESLKEAANELGLEFVENQRSYRWFGHSVGDYPIPEGFKEEDLGKCEHALRIPGNSGAYEIGVVKNRTGNGYTLLWDFWMGGYGLVQKVGTGGDKLKDTYLTRHTVRHWKKKGYKVTTTQLENGHMQVKVRK